MSRICGGGAAAPATIGHVIAVALTATWARASDPNSPRCRFSRQDAKNDPIIQRPEIVLPEQSDDPPGVFGDDAARPGTRTMRWVASYFASFVVFVGVDFLWLSAMVGRVYRPTMGDIALANVNFPPAIVFYGLYPIGLLTFAVAPAVKAESLAYGASVRRAFRVFHLRDLRSHQSGHAAQLDHGAIAHRYGVGHRCLLPVRPLWVISLRAGFERHRQAGHRRGGHGKNFEVRQLVSVKLRRLAIAPCAARAEGYRTRGRAASTSG